MSSSFPENYGGIGAFSTIYQRLLGRGTPDTKGEKTPSTTEGAVSAEFNLMELSSPVNNPARSECNIADEAARQNYDHMFKDPNALEFLLRCTQDSKHIAMDSGKESILNRFDPLLAGRPSESFADIDASTASTSSSGFGSHTDSNMSILEKTIMTPKRTGSVNTLRDKPTQIVVPAQNRILSDIARPPLVRSVSAIMSPARVAVDRLISYGDQQSPPVNLFNSTPPQYDPRIERLHSLKELLQKQEQDAHKLREENSDLKFKIRDLEKLIQKVTEEEVELKEKERKLTRQLQDKALCNKQMGIAMEEYEKTISSLIGEQQAEKTAFKEKEKALRLEQEQVQSHLLSMESAFNDLLAKYEKCKIRMNEFKDLEESHRKKIVEYEKANIDLEEQYDTLKTMASDKLSKANETLETMKKSHEFELMKLNAMIKKYDVQVSSLQESLAQKIKDNEQLTGICDELISKDYEHNLLHLV